jgi:hypothetical protein
MRCRPMSIGRLTLACNMDGQLLMFCLSKGKYIGRLLCLAFSVVIIGMKAASR